MVPIKGNIILRGEKWGCYFFPKQHVFGKIQWKRNTLSDPAIFNAKSLAQFDDKLLFGVQAINNMNHNREVDFLN